MPWWVSGRGARGAQFGVTPWLSAHLPLSCLQRTGSGVPGGRGHRVGAVGGWLCAPAPAPDPRHAPVAGPVPARRDRAGPARGVPPAAKVSPHGTRGHRPLPKTPSTPCLDPCAVGPCVPHPRPPWTCPLPAGCGGDLVALSCGKPCPRSCSDLREDTACLDGPRCQPACACPPGRLLQDGACVPPERCRCPRGAGIGWKRREGAGCPWMVGVGAGCTGWQGGGTGCNRVWGWV